MLGAVVGIGLLALALTLPEAAAATGDPPGDAPLVRDEGAPVAAPGPAAGAWVASGREERWPLPRPRRGSGAYVAKVLVPSRGRERLDGSGRRWSVPTRTSWSGQSMVLLVLSSAVRQGRKWVKLRLPQRPNGTAAWVRRDHVLIGQVPYWVHVRTGSRRVSVYRKGRLVRRFRAVVGAPGTPTPRGLGAIYERNRQPDPKGFLGPWALSLTFMSNVLESYGGGPGRVAIHGRGGESLLDPLGTARSHGCIRVGNGQIRWAARHLPKGTPVRITG